MTQNWQAAVLARFEPKAAPMVLAIDPDNLMHDEELVAQLQARSFDILELEDEVQFRAAFERDYRARWDDGEMRHLVVIVHTTDAARHIPYDIYAKSRRVELDLADLFPHLNAIVVRQLDRAYYAALYQAQQTQLAPKGAKPLGEQATIEFILRAVFALDPLAANTPEDVVALLIEKHYAARQMPPTLEAYVADHILPVAAPLGLTERELADARSLWAWLGQRWAEYAQAILAGKPAPGLDFSRPRLRLLMDNLFSERLVPQVRLDDLGAAASLPANLQWVRIGLALPPSKGDGSKVRQRGEQSLYDLHAWIERLEAHDTADMTLREWLDHAATWAQVVHLANMLPTADYGAIAPRVAALRHQLDAAFQQFLVGKYGAIAFYDDARGPISLAAVNPWLQALGADRIALLCFDGLALDEWPLLRTHLQQRLGAVAFHENRTYAIAPTLTPLSRQALFAGRLPDDFSNTAGTTTHDGKRWQQYWVNHEVPTQRVAYQSVQVSGKGLDAVMAIVQGTNRRLGIVVNLFDEVVHETSGMSIEADKRVAYTTMAAHLENGHIDALVGTLLDAGYRVFITSDHGNIVAQGSGLQPPRALAEPAAKRVVLFDQKPLAQGFAKEHDLLYYRTKFLPDTLHPVYVPGEGLYASSSTVDISHGGLSLEELVVPFVEVARS